MYFPRYGGKPGCNGTNADQQSIETSHEEPKKRFQVVPNFYFNFHSLQRISTIVSYPAEPPPHSPQFQQCSPPPRAARFKSPCSKLLLLSNILPNIPWSLTFLPNIPTTVKLFSPTFQATVKHYTPTFQATEKHSFTSSGPLVATVKPGPLKF